MSSTVSVFLADGFEEIEALAVVDLLRRAEIRVTTWSISDSLQLTGRSGICVTADQMWDEKSAGEADMLVLPGGQPGTTSLGQHEGLREQLLKAAEEGRFVAAICAAPTVLAKHGLLKGKKAVCYPGLEAELIRGGADAGSQSVVRDGKVITSRGAGTAIPFALKLIDALEGEDAAEQVRKSIVFE